MQPRSPSPPDSAPRRRGWIWLLVPLLLWCASSLVRVQLAFGDPEFDTRSAESLLKADPGLLYYLTERVVESAGVPSDWRADPRIEHPDRVDVPAVFTVGQEFLVAAAYRLHTALSPRPAPLHVFCVWLMAFVASLAVFAVWGLSRELTGDSFAASLATLLYVCTPAAYRTVGFILVREDLSLPLFAFHLWALARVARPGRLAESPSRSPWAPLAAGLTLLAALATWHGMGFLVALEAVACVVLFLARGVNPLGSNAGRAVFLLVLAGSIAVPALSAKLVSLPPWLFSAILLVALGLFPDRFRASLVQRFGALLGCGLLLAIASTLVAPALGARPDLAHVPALVASKLRHLGQFPSDPSVLPFDVRLMWQGPFATAGPAVLWASLLLTLPLLAAGLTRALVARPRALFVEGWGLGALLALVAAWLVARNLVLVPILACPLAALLARPASGVVTRRVLAAAVVAQLALFSRWATNLELSWYRPALRQDEIAAMVQAVRVAVPDGEAIAADFMNSTAILAHTRHPIVLQPKWERSTTRRRVERFWEFFYHGTPEDMRVYLLEELDCRYLLVDRFTLWILDASPVAAGLSPTLPAPPPGSAAEALLDPALGAPGYELVWRSPPTFLQSNGRPSDFYRLYRLEEGSGR